MSGPKPAKALCVRQEPPPPLPPTVEGRECSAEELRAKAANGSYYLDDVWRIVREFPSADVFDCPGKLETLTRRLSPALEPSGYRVVEASARFEGLVHATQLAQAWAQLVHDARNSDILYIVRRTAGNTGALLALQRIEHLRGECSEFSPLALVALVRGEQRLFPRHEVPEAEALEALLSELVAADADAAAPPRDASPTPAAAPQTPAPPPGRANLPPALFARQMTALAAVMSDLGVEVDDGSPIEVEEDDPALLAAAAEAK